MADSIIVTETDTNVITVASPGLPVDTDVNLTADSDNVIPSQRAVKTYVDTSLGGNLATVAHTGSYNDLLNQPSLAFDAAGAAAAAQAYAIQRSNHTGSQSVATITGLATVATSGSYTDLSNKPTLATVASTGAYSDLTGKPTLGTLSSLSSVALSNMANLAANSIIGNNTASPTTPIALTTAQTKSLLAIASTDVSGLGTLATLSSAPAGTLTGTTLNSTVVTSSLTSVGALASGSAASGFTVADACLSSNIPLKNAANTFTAANYITGTGGLNVGSATAPKGTGVAGSKLEIMGTGTGGSAFGSLAISRADSTSASLAGSIDFYTVSTLAAQIQCNQVSGGAGGINAISFNLGSAGTMVTPLQLNYASGSATGTLSLGASNGSLQGKLAVTNYASAANTTSITLSNPVSSGNTGSTSILWIDGAGGNSIGQIRTNYLAAAGVGDIVFSVGTGVTNNLQDFVKFTNTSKQEFYLLDSVSNQKVGAIYPQWQNSTDATRAGQINFTAMNTTNENTAFYYWADTASSTRMVFAANTVGFNGTGSVNFTAGIQMPNTVSILFNNGNATSGTTLTNSGNIRFNSSYWNGAASAASIGYLLSRNAYTSQGSVCLAYQINAGSGVTDMFSAGAATTGAEASQLTLSSVIVSGGLSYPAYGVTTSWSNNTVVTRASTVNLGAYYTTTLQTGITIQGNSGGSPYLSFYGATPIARPTLPSAGSVTASDIRTALINLGLCQ